MAKRSGSSRRKRAKQRAAAAAAYPPWVLLERFGIEEVLGSSSSIANTSTLAVCCTAAANPIGVALCVAAPPEASRVCVQHPTGAEVSSHPVVLAAHADSVLIQVALNKDAWKDQRVHDYFVYSAGNAAVDPPRPPSLLLLPALFYSPEEEVKFLRPRRSRGPQLRFLSSDCTGLLRPSEDELVVAELVVNTVEVREGTPSRKAAELVLFRAGEWSVKRPPFSHGTDGREAEELLSSWEPRAVVVPVGDRLLCWSDMSHGVIFSDVFDEDPTLRYVPFPGESPYGFAVCATAGGDSVKLVKTCGRCCCGEVGSSNCRHSLNAYTIRTWTLRMDDMTWVMDAMVDATELWALDAYHGLPRVHPCNPVVSLLDDPNTITFVLCESFYVRHGGDDTVWLVMVDTRRKLIPSVFRYPRKRPYINFRSLLPSRVSGYLSSYPCRSKIHMESAPPPIVVDDPQTNDAIDSSAQSFCNMSVEPLQQTSKEVSLERKILMTLEEIPGLARDEMLKAYSILVFDNGRRLRSLLELPMSLRKEWLLIEIKASEACSTCSACTKDDVQYA